MPDDAVCFQHDVIPTTVNLAFQHLDVTRAVPPHEGEQLAEKDVSQRLLAQAGIGRMRRGRNFCGICWSDLGRLGHAADPIKEVVRQCACLAGPVPKDSSPASFPTTVNIILFWDNPIIGSAYPADD